MTDTDPNRLGPVTREWVAALERRIEELEAKYERLETIASMQPDQQFDVRVETAANDLAGMERPVTEGVELTTDSVASPSQAGVGEAPATVLCKGRKVSLQEAAEIAMRTLADAERGRDEAATIHLVRRSPESAAVYWREQWEKMHAEVVSLRAQLATRPVVAATDEQITALIIALSNCYSTYERHTAIRRWLSTLGVVQEPKVQP